MEPYYADSSVTLWHGDALEVLRELPDASVDAVVTDPPYGLGFMGKEWDSGKSFVERRAAKSNTFDHVGGNHNPANSHDQQRTRLKENAAFGEWCEAWATECLRVLKPGGHMLAFGGSRTWHRLAAGIEDAGFEIRDSIAWLYGSGFPKSLDVSKAVERRERGAMVREKLLHFAAERGIDGKWLEECGVASAASFADWTTGGHVPSERNWNIVKAALEVTPDEEAAFEREVLAEGRSRIDDGTVYGLGHSGRRLGGAVTDAAAQWQGWGTALKPAFEPIVVARKPLAGTVAANVLAYGTGALNIDACRIDTNEPLNGGAYTERSSVSDALSPSGMNVVGAKAHGEFVQPSGRWPANVILDESQAAVLDGQSGESVSRIGQPRGAANGDGWGMTATGAEYDDQGGASRFFYVAKADSSERVRVNGVAHPTVKPLELMRRLVRLVTPPGGLVLEPFAGSGTTVEACLLEGMRCVAIEREADYLPLIRQRIDRRRDPVAAIVRAGDDAGLFALIDEGGVA